MIFRFLLVPIPWICFDHCHRNLRRISICWRIPFLKGQTWDTFIHSMQSHVNHEGVVTFPNVHPLVLLVLVGVQLALLLYTAVVSRNLDKLHQAEVSRTHLSLLLRGDQSSWVCTHPHLSGLVFSSSLDTISATLTSRSRISNDDVTVNSFPVQRSVWCEYNLSLWVWMQFSPNYRITMTVHITVSTVPHHVMGEVC